MSPKVAAAIDMVSALFSPMLSSTALNPPAVPCPPAIEIEPVAMPMSGLMCISLVMPKGIAF